MAKMKTSVLFIGALILVLITVVSTYLVLLATKVIPADPIKLEITIVDKQKTYDGSPLQADEYNITSGKLLNGHSLSLEYIGSITDAGNIKSNAVCHVYDTDHTDHTNEYVFKINQGNLTVTKKNLSLKIDENDVNYGTDSNFDSEITYSIVNGGLCSGHKIIPTYEYREIENNTKLSTTMTAEIFDANGVNVTKNYTLDYSGRDLNITKTKLVYRTLSKTKTYDGEAFGDDDFSSQLAYGTLPFGYTEEITYDYAGRGNVGSTTLGITSVTIYDEHGDDVTNRFDIDKQNTGILTITPLEINITVNNETVEYDGIGHSNEEFEIKTDVNITAKDRSFNYNNKEFIVEAKGEKHINAGSYINVLDFTISDSNGEDVSSNFRIEQTQSILTISKRPLVIYADSDTSVYDGTTHSLNNKQVPDKDPQGLLSGHSIKVEYSDASQITDVGEVENEIFSYEIRDEKNNNMNNNYDVRTVSGKIVVTKKTINITGYVKNKTTNIYSDYYRTNGYKNIINQVEFRADQNTNYTITVTELNYSELKHAGTYNILPTKYVLEEGNNELDDDELANYEINISPVVYEIKRLPVIITVKSTEAPLNTNLEDIDLDAIAITLDDNYYGEFDSDFDIVLGTEFVDETKTGTYNITVSLEKIKDASADDYIITIIPGTVTIVNP